MEPGPLPQLHEGPPACHPTTLLINSILTQLSSGSSQEGSVNWGGGASSCHSVLASYFPLFPSDLVETESVSLSPMLVPMSVHSNPCPAYVMLNHRRLLNDVLPFMQVLPLPFNTTHLISSPSSSHPSRHSSLQKSKLQPLSLKSWLKSVKVSERSHPCCVNTLAVEALLTYHPQSVQLSMSFTSKKK